MEGKVLFTMRYVVFIFLFLVEIWASGQNKNDLKCIFKQLYISGNMNAWADLVDSLQQLTLNSSDDNVLLFAEYGLVGYYMGMERKEDAEYVLQRFENHINSKIEREPENANYNAFKAAAYGFKIGLAPWKAPFLSYYHQSYVSKAVKYRKDEFLPIIEQANSYYFRPVFVGGNKQKALVEYNKANQILQKQKECNWSYFSNTAWLGQVFIKLNMIEKAKDLYLKILKEEPDFKYVKDELLPQLESGKFNDIGGRFERLFE